MHRTLLRTGSPEWFAAIRRALIAWYRRHARELPWRGTRDPYRVWVSEIMLQQTQVATVISYYERFLRAFPDVHALAAARESDVLRHWEGLGYYRRARQFHRAARLVVGDFGGALPRDAATWRTLPGIGRYTAGAIASLAFDAREPILEANTERLWSRLLAWRRDSRGASGRQALWQAADDVLARSGSGAVNQALMDLGSQICTPREPACELCPLARLCPTKRLGLQNRIPRPKPKMKTESQRVAAIVVKKRNRVLIGERAAGGRWGGLWDFPRVEISQPHQEDEGCVDSGIDAVARIESAIGVRAKWQSWLTRFQHSVTRFRITVDCHEATYRGGRAEGPDFACFAWVAPAELGNYPLSVTGRRIARLIAGS